MTKEQEINQCEGPYRPTVESLKYIFSTLPKHLKIRAVSINGQTGQVIVETYYEELELAYKFPYSIK